MNAETPEREVTPSIIAAADWLASTPRHKRPRAVIIELRERFHLNAVQAITAIMVSSAKSGQSDMRTLTFFALRLGLRIVQSEPNPDVAEERRGTLALKHLDGTSVGIPGVNAPFLLEQLCACEIAQREAGLS